MIFCRSSFFHVLFEQKFQYFRVLFRGVFLCAEYEFMMMRD